MRTGKAHACFATACAACPACKAGCQAGMGIGGKIRGVGEEKDPKMIHVSSWGLTLVRGQFWGL